MLSGNNKKNYILRLNVYDTATVIRVIYEFVIDAFDIELGCGGTR